MNIMFFSSDNNVKSGAFLSLVKLTQLLKDLFECNVLVVLPKPGAGEKLLDDAGIRYVIIHSYDWTLRIHHSVREFVRIPKRYFINKRAINEALEQIKDFHPDLIHINTSWSYVGAVAAVKCDVPFVWHIREFLEEDQRRKIWNRKIGYSTLNKADRILCISKGIYNKYSNILNRNKLQVVYNGIDVDRYYNPDKEIFIDSQEINFLCVGGLYRGKGHSLLIDACSKLLKEGYQGFRLKIVGTGAEEESLKRQVEELNLSQIVDFEGYQSDTVGYYQNADIMFMLSKSEAFGRVTIEAMLGGVLVIGSNSGATPEILGNDEYGYLYNPGDAEDLVRCIKHVLENKIEARQTMEKGRAYAAEHFSAVRNANEVKKVYDSIIGKQ